MRHTALAVRVRAHELDTGSTCWAASWLLRIRSAMEVVMHDEFESYHPSFHSSSRPISQAWKLPSAASTVTSSRVSVDFTSVARMQSSPDMKEIASPGCTTATRAEGSTCTMRGIRSLPKGERA